MSKRTQFTSESIPDLLDLFTIFFEEYMRQDASSVALLREQVVKLVEEVCAVGENDLRVQAEVTPDALGVVADAFNYLIEEFSKVIVRVQKTTAQEIATSSRMLSVLQQEIQKLEGIVEQVLAPGDANAHQNLAISVFDICKSTKALEEDAERISDLSNKLYASVSHFLLRPEESLHWE